MNKLAQLRNVIATLDETLVKVLCGRAAFKVNGDLYGGLCQPLSVNETAKLFRSASTNAGRAHVLRPLYAHSLLPALCEPGSDLDRRKCGAADTACMNALVQRLNLSLQVAALKLEETPDSLRKPLHSRDPEQMEQAITNHQVEAEVIAHILEVTRGQQPSGELPQRIARLYEEWIFPLSRKIQVHDLLVRPRT